VALAVHAQSVAFLLGSMALCVVPTFLHAIGVAIEQPAWLFAKVIIYSEMSGKPVADLQV